MATRTDTFNAGHRPSASWGEFARGLPISPSSATCGSPRGPPTWPPSTIRVLHAVHPVTPIVGDGRLFVFMEPTSPKGDDIARRGAYALHCLVTDANGTGGEFYVRGHGEQVDDPRLRGDRRPGCELRTERSLRALRAAHRRGAMQSATATSRCPSPGRGGPPIHRSRRRSFAFLGRRCRETGGGFVPLMRTPPGRKDHHHDQRRDRRDSGQAVRAAAAQRPRAGPAGVQRPRRRPPGHSDRVLDRGRAGRDGHRAEVGQGRRAAEATRRSR